MQNDHILRVVSKLLIGPILLYGLHVLWHSDHGVGGGFQAGVILAAAFILYGIVFGVEALLDIVSPATLRACAAFGILLYAGTGLVALIADKSYLDYSPLMHDAITAQHLGILLVELGISIAVLAAILLIFAAFVSRISEGNE